jgi:hypothetical protein
VRRQGARRGGHRRDGAPAEEAAILYANGACEEARIVLEQALDVTTATEARFDLWVMLLDLLRLTGQRDNFEALSLMFATEFERSPSAWQDLSTRIPARASPRSRRSICPAT